MAKILLSIAGDELSSNNPEAGMHFRQGRRERSMANESASCPYHGNSSRPYKVRVISPMIFIRHRSPGAEISPMAITVETASIPVNFDRAVP
jgi:hypothetical protein